MKSLFLATTALMALAAPASAEQHTTLKAVPGGDQIKVAVCSPTKRTEIVGVVGQPTTFTFPTNESVYMVSQTTKDGTPEGQASWNSAQHDKDNNSFGNNLTLWPSEKGITIMTVVTKIEPGETQKPYPFKLIAKPKDADFDGAVFNLICKGGPPLALHATSGDDQPKARRVSRRQKQQDDDDRTARERLRVDAFNGVGGCHYSAHGIRPNPLEPLCPLDNGQWTIMRFKGLTPKPSVYIATSGALCGAEDGKDERLPRQHGSGDYIVIEEIAQRFCVRLGMNVLQIDNNAYDPAGAPTGTDTLDPSVYRQVLKAKAN